MKSSFSYSARVPSAKRTWQAVNGILLAVASGCGSGEGDDGYAGPAVPLRVTGAVSIESDDRALIVLTTATSPVDSVNDGKVTINGVTIPRSPQGGYMFQGASPVHAGDELTLRIERGVTITTTLRVPGRVEFTAPQPGSVQNASAPVHVAWNAPAALPDEYHFSVPSKFADSSFGWSEDVLPPATSLDIPAGELKPAVSGIVILSQSVRRTSVFEGETLASSMLQVNVRAESGSFSTQ
jgi:hypothetical protein